MPLDLFRFGDGVGYLNIRVTIMRDLDWERRVQLWQN
jgi:hypothetical protein